MDKKFFDKFKGGKRPEEINKAMADQLFKKETDHDKIVSIDLNSLKENPYQPRMEIKEEQVQELADSIEKNGLLQPILVSPTPSKDSYYIIAGHRRVAAHRLLGKKKIKAIVVDDEGDRMLAAKAIVENFQREDLNPIELAFALKRYQEEFGKSVKEIAADIGKSESVVSRIINLLNLPTEIIEDVRKNKSTKDVTALSEINALPKKLEKLHMHNFDAEELQKSLYYGLLEHGRKWLSSEIKRILRKEEGSKRLVRLKKERRRVVLSIQVSPKEIPEEKLEEIVSAIEKILHR